MKCYFLWCVLMLSSIISRIDANTQGACAYDTLDGNVKPVRYNPQTDISDEYIDFGNNKDGICIQRAKCNKGFITTVDKCEEIQMNLDCHESNNEDEPSFPSCCKKC